MVSHSTENYFKFSNLDVDSNCALYTYILKPNNTWSFARGYVYTKTEVDTALAGKQDTISDLATIRSGASAGATAYQKPSTGIPASDLAAGVIPTVTPEVFWATRGTTTYAEVLAAYNAGKLVCVNHNGVVFVLSSYNSTDSEFLFASCDEEFHIAFLYLHSEDDEWESVGTPLAGTVSPTFTGTPKAPTAATGTNTTQIATTAFVQGEISGKENTSNKVTSLSSSSTDTQYPSAKCVYDMIGDIESVLDQIIQPTNS